MAQDIDIQQHISGLIDEERGLRDRLARGEISPVEEHAKLRALEVELDQCWDLLRQRRAKREYGEDPGDAQVRSERTVEGYTG
ncbi:DUF2630 family protein [Lapillicoccus sp.]|jgi:hypothetical protein|uniref:DUF2630 family protein n=1 Tax=Lapillicoccus sp. TaxID=1909287 RepID=UPI0025D0B8C5|nr:DUF2630 family protein [Lapillicoccus sp.]